MPKLTKTFVDDIPAPEHGDTIVWDTELKGFGVRVRSSGAKTYVIQYRNADGLSRRMVVARTDTLTPDLARRLAKKQLGAVAGGHDPSADRQALRAGSTISELCDWYLTEARAGRLLSRNRRPIKATSLAGDRARIDQHIKPLLGGRAVRTVTLGDIERLQAEIASGKSAAAQKRKGRGGNTRGGAGVAGRTVATLRAILSHAVRWDLIPKNPALGVRQIPTERKTRRLSETEIKGLGEAMRQSEAHAELPAGMASIQLMLMTGFRRMEALGLRCDWLDEHCVHFPDTKTGKQLRVIGVAASELIRRQREREDQVYVFPSDRSDGHLIGADRVLDRLCVMASLKDVTLHTLRHTFASVAADLGYTELTIAGLLGHAAQGVTQRYVHVDKALVTAADQISIHLAGLLGLDLDVAPDPAAVGVGVADLLLQPRWRGPMNRPLRIEWPLPVSGQSPARPSGEDVTSAAPLRALRTEDDYKAALVDYGRGLAAPAPTGSAAAVRLDMLGLLLCTYEEARQPIAQDPLDTLTLVMQAKGKTPNDLAGVLGPARASALMERGHPLALEDVRRLRTEWGIPAAMLV